MSSNVLPPEMALRARPVKWRQAEGSSSQVQAKSAATLVPQPEAERPSAPAINVDEIRRAAFAEGLGEGERRAQEQAAAQLQPMLERLTNMLGSLATQRTRIRRDAEAELVRLSIAIARRILNRELMVDPTSIQGLLKAALEKIERSELSQVRVSPDQVATVSLCVERLSGRPLKVVADSSLQPWQILFETEKGAVDSSVETQLKEIERGFADRLAK